MSRVEQARVKLREWRENPCKFVNEVFNVVPDKWQEEALNIFPSQDRDKMRVSLQAAVGPGKSALLSWLGWNFLSCYGEVGEHPKGAAISVTYDNLKDNLWPEFSKWQSRSEFLMKAFKWTKERIFSLDHPETWFMSARSWSKTANAEEQGRTLSGLHSKFILVLVDESGEIPLSVLNAGEQALSNCEWGKIIQAGNPTSLEGMLYFAATKLRHQWYVIRITGDPDDPMRSPRIDINWAKEQIKTYGRDNPWIMSSILGQFPPSSINALLGPDEVESAMVRHWREPDYEYSQKRLGIDCARFGDDRTVIFPRQGLVAFKPAIMRNATGPEIASRVALARDKWGSEIQIVDDTGGYGATVIDSLKQATIPVVPVSFSGKATDPRYLNKRAEIWFRMAEWVKRGGALPKMPELVKELTTPTYTFSASGKFLIEPKDKIKERLGFSPDLSDALALTFAFPDRPGTPYMGYSAHVGRVETEFDPYDDTRP